MPVTSIPHRADVVVGGYRLQESWLQPAKLRAMQAQPKQAVPGQLCAQVLGGRQAAGQVRWRDPGGAHQH